MTRSRLAWPFLAVIGVLVVVPLAMAAWLAVTDYTGITAPTYTGTENVERLTRDGVFWHAVVTTAILAAVVIPVRLVLATGAALLLHAPGRLRGPARAAVYLPSVVPDAAWALLWLWILNPLFGPLPALLRAIGAPVPGFLTSPNGALLGLGILLVVQIGEGFVVALAARAQIPRSLYEVAAVEGARPTTVLRRVTLPLMAPVLGVLALRDAVVVLQVSFVPALLIGGREPLYATLTAPLAVYRRAFQYGELGYASLLSLTLLALTVAASGVIWGGWSLAGRLSRAGRLWRARRVGSSVS